MIRHHVRSYGTNKIMAIKLVRELTRSGLREAKDLVELAQGFAVVVGPSEQARIAELAREHGIEFDPPLDGTVWSADERDEYHDSGPCSVRYVSGPRKIEAIKLVRELTGLGLKEAKDVVDNATMIRVGVSIEEAAAIANRFADIGALTEIVEGQSLPKPSVGSAYDDEDDYDF